MVASSRVRVAGEWEGDVSWVDIFFTASGIGADIELEHASRPGPHWDEFGPAATGLGWEQALVSLGSYLRDGAAFDPAAVQGWLASEDGVRFVRLGGELWAAAEEATGTPPGIALARANRSVDAYTGAD